MANYARGGGTYRGRKTANDLIRLTAIVLALLVLVALGIYLFIREGYLVYTSEGARLNLPFMQQAQDSDQSAPLPEIQVEVQEPTLPPEPEPDPVRKLVEVQMSDLVDGTAAQIAEQAGANGIVLNMKDDSGALSWYAQDDVIAANGISVGAQELNEAIRQLNETSIYTVARISCFKDDALGANHDYAIRTNSGYRWTDPEGIRWTSPTHQATQDYLLARMEELAQLGFDEILLDNCGYPTRGNLGYIKKGSAYDRNELSTVITGFLQRAQQALAPYEIILSVRCSEAVFTGEDIRSGLTAGALEGLAEHIWLAQPQEIAPLLQSLTQAGLTDLDTRLVFYDGAWSAGYEGHTAQINIGNF